MKCFTGCRKTTNSERRAKSTSVVVEEFNELKKELIQILFHPPGQSLSKLVALDGASLKHVQMDGALPEGTL